LDKQVTKGQIAALRVITEQMSEAVSAPKCHTCGCLHKTVEALSSTEVGQTELGSALQEARSVFKPKQYDCLGCPVCYPAIATNAFAEAFPELGSGLDLCPTDEPLERQGWPPLPGDYHVLRYQAPVGVCTLNSEPVARLLKDRAPEGLAIVGTLHTENLGIERIIHNTVANPNIRFLILCGEDTQQSIGHLPGQSLQSLFENGVDERSQIRGARGKRPVLKNVSVEEIQAFIEQVELIPMIGEQNDEVIAKQVETSRIRDPGAYVGAPNGTRIEVIQAADPERLTLDTAGYFVVYPDRRSHRLVLEHYTNAGVLDCVMEATSSPALYAEAIRRDLIGRLEHAAYLGRELARAESSLETGDPYVQDKAPGATATVSSVSSCGCNGSCDPEGELR
jgi:tetrahydromethanopterin S-methyltransferase subunit A